jgi:GntR family transcriptional regulator, arabinose operon transcriptional repressor
VTDETRPVGLEERDGRTAAHRRIADVLRAEIEAGAHPPGARLPAEPALAARFGVSRGTLRQALQNLARAGLVEAVPGRGTFVAHGSPRRRDGRRRVIGVVVPSVAEPFVPDLLGWIEDELHARGYSMLVGSSGSTREQQAGRIHRILAEGASGLIAYPLDYDPDPPLFGHLVERAFPVVLVDRYIVGLAIDAVQADNVGGAYAAVAHLAALGHRRIAFVSTDNLTTTSVAERLQGYEQALRAYGIDRDRDLVFTRLQVRPRWPSAVPDGAPPDVAAIARFLERGRPTAVFALHQGLALDAIQAASHAGLAVPSDLAVVGFDDDAPASRAWPPLTVVAQPLEAMGRAAARLVVERAEGRRTETARIVLPTSLVVRASSGGAVGPAAVAAG